jgi:hypothetical protein
MNNIFILAKSNKPTKKWMINFFNEKTNRYKTVHFGARNAQDFTMHHDLERLRKYDLRHKTRENWNDITTPGALSKWFLWNPNAYTIDEAIPQIENSFNIRIVKA